MSEPATHATIPSLPPFGISTALLAGEVPPPAANGQPPEWIKMTPRGRAATRDGRSYAFDPEALVARFDADKVDVPVDLDHGLALRALRGERVDSVGYATALQARPDGTYARVNWLDGGKAVLAARTHRYVSPTFPHDTAGNATWLHSISLVAAPALPAMPALAAARPDGTAPATLAEALGLDAAADEAACLSAIGALRASLVPIGLFNDAVAALNMTNATLAARDSETRKEKVIALIEGALKARKIVPAVRQQYEALCQTEAGFAQVATLFANQPDLLPASGLNDVRRFQADLQDETPIALAARATRYREEQRRSGATISQADAIAHAVANPTAGR